MWMHAVLEIYTHVVSDSEGVVEKWPDEGTAADWIALGLVGYCQGDVEDLANRIPLVLLLAWRLKSWIENIRWNLGLD